VRIFRFIAAKRAEHSIQIMCRVLEVSRSGFHAWVVRDLSTRALADEKLAARIATIHTGSRCTYGLRAFTPSCASRTAYGLAASGSSG